MEKKFTANEIAKEPVKQRTKNTIDECLQSSPGNIKNLVVLLKQKNIYTVLRQNTEGRLYGITFVDNQNKVVFNGSDLGKGYSAAALQSRLGVMNKNPLSQDETKGSSSSGVLLKENDLNKHQEKTISTTAKNENLFDVLLSTKEQYDITPNNLLKKKRKKKKKPMI